MTARLSQQQDGQAYRGPVLDDAALAPLRRHFQGEILNDAFSLARYSTDASIYQIMPLAVVIPRDRDDVAAAVAFARDAGVPLLPRGAGTSQCGQTVGEALVIDFTKHMNNLLETDLQNETVSVEPGIVLDRLNGLLRPHGRFFPVDVSTASRATIGGMAGNNSCGARSIRYGNMVHNVQHIRALLSDGTAYDFGETPGNLGGDDLLPGYRDLVADMRRLATAEKDEIARRFPKLLRRVGGYNIDSIQPTGHNMASLLVGSEGTLATFTEITLKLQKIPGHRVLAVCHFPTFFAAMETTQHIVKLDPSAVELADRTMLELAREIPLFQRSIARFIQGQPESVLFVEFAGDDPEENFRRLHRLNQLMGDHGFPEAVVEAIDPAFQQEIWEVRKAGLNIMMSMKGDGKPVSFIEDCAVALPDLADYTARLNEVFAKHGTRGTWYAHASVGCLHVRPVLNMKDPADIHKMRAIAEEAFAMVHAYKGSHSGEHGDGLVRSEFHRPMFGDRLVEAFGQVKRRFDSGGLMNPGKIVDPPKMDDRRLFRYGPAYKTTDLKTGLDWSAWGGFGRAVEMCNNNGACRKAGGVMCPSFQATRNERDVTRGRANSLRMALSGQLGPEALTSKELYETLSLCVGCKGCKRECPTGVDMAAMKTEFLYQYHQKHPRSLGDRLIAALPRYAPYMGQAAGLVNGMNNTGAGRQILQRLFGISPKRSLPQWSKEPFADKENPEAGVQDRPAVAMFVDCFNRYFEPEIPRATTRLFAAAGYRVEPLVSGTGARPLCCGRTYLSVGDIDRAKREAERCLSAAATALQDGAEAVIGLEPSCLFSFRDEYEVLFSDSDRMATAGKLMLAEEFIAGRKQAGAFSPPLHSLPEKHALVHGHCHQKAFGVMPAVLDALSLVPELQSDVIASSCCGMAGSFGYKDATYDVSMQMAEAALLPVVRAAPEQSLIVADGTSCRHQISDNTKRKPEHVMSILARALT